MNDSVYDDVCSRCGAAAPLTDWDEVDVGIGSIRGNLRYTCPTHGEFAYALIPQSERSPGGRSVRAVFRDEVSPFASAGLDDAEAKP